MDVERRERLDYGQLWMVPDSFSANSAKMNFCRKIGGPVKTEVIRVGIQDESDQSDNRVSREALTAPRLPH